MSTLKYSNFFRATIANSGGISAVATTVQLNITSGALPALGNDEHTYLVLQRMSDFATEIVKVTAHDGAGNVTAMVRAIGGTTALVFLQNDRVGLRVTKEVLDDFRADITELAGAANTLANEALQVAENANTIAADAKEVADGIAAQAAAALAAANAAQADVNALEADALSKTNGGTVSGDVTFTGDVNLQGANLLGGNLVPTGAIVAFPVETAPNGYLECAGQAVSKVTYNALYEFLKDGTGQCIYGETADTFHVPDLRGRFLRGWDHGAGRDPDRNSRTNRKIGSNGATVIGDRVGTSQEDQNKAHTHSTSINWIEHNDDGVNGGIRGLFFGQFSPHQDQLTGTQPYTSASNGGAEGRPKNVYVLWCIKT